MEKTSVPEPLAHFLGTSCNVNAPLIEDLREQILHPKLPKRAAVFRQ